MLRGLASSAADGPAVSTNGYTNLENYLNDLAGDPVPDFGKASAGPGGRP